MSMRTGALRGTALIISLTALSACSDGQLPAFLQAQPGGEEVVSRAASGPVGTEERDVEAPNIFEAREAGLWDGRPSLGGVWIAHPDVKEPERAILRNETNGKYVIGALFRREREAPGPALQVSSDAAAALGILAGAPTQLHVVALRREEVPVEEPALSAPVDEVAAQAVPAAPDVTEGAIDPVISNAAAAIETASLDPAETVAVATGPAAVAQTAPKPVQTAAVAPAKPAGSLDKPFIQIGIFSVEQNAQNTATAMRQAGMVPTVRKQTSKGKTFWRVIVGPAQTKSERSALLKTIKQSGFADAYAVTN